MRKPGIEEFFLLQKVKRIIKGSELPLPASIRVEKGDFTPSELNSFSAVFYNFIRFFENIVFLLFFKVNLAFLNPLAQIKLK